MTSATGTANPPPAQLELPFAVRVMDGRAGLLLADRTVFGWLRVTKLELEVPRLELPIDVAGGATRFQRRRCKVLGAELSVDDAALEALALQSVPRAWSRGIETGGAGFEELRVRVLEGVIEVSGRVRVADRSAELTARIYLAERPPRGVRATLTDVRVYGFVGRALPLLAHDLLCTLAGASSVVHGMNGNGAASTPDAPTVRGLADLELHPLETFLWSAMPPAGWRLPDAAATRLTALSITRGKLVLRFADQAAGPSAADEAADVRRRRQTHFATLDQLAVPDGKLIAGDVDGAVAAYRGASARGGADAPVALERLLGVLVARDNSLREAEQLAREALVRWPDFVPAHLTLAAVFVERGRHADAAEHFVRVVELAEEAGDDEDAVRAATAAARLLRDVDERGATPFWERVLERRPAHAEAAEALALRYMIEERWSDLLRLSRRRIAASPDRREQAREHARLGEIYLTRLGDPEGAREELQRATEIEDGDPRAWDGLGRALAALGDHQGAARALERVVQLHAAKGDVLGEARMHARIAVLWEVAGDDGAAHLRYRRALELTPEDADALERLAQVAARRGHRDEAVATWERVAELAAADEPRRRRARRELARVYLLEGDLERARKQLERGTGGDGAEEADRLVLLSALEEQAGRLDLAVTALARAAELELPADTVADLELRRALVHDALGQAGEADVAREHAFALSPELAGPAAGHALVESARTRGDLVAEARWLDALLAIVPRKTDPGAITLVPFAGREGIAIRRAELLLEAGSANEALVLLDNHVEQGEPSAERLRAKILRALGDAPGSAALLERLAGERQGSMAGVELLVDAARAQLAADDTQAALRDAHAALLELVTLGLDERPDLTDAARQILGETAWELRSWPDVIAAYEPLLEHGTAIRAPGGEDMTPWVEAARRLGMALERSGRDADALKMYRAAVEDEPARGEPLASVWRRLAELCERSGDFAAAADALSEGAADPRTVESPSARAEQHHRAAELLRKRLGSPVRALAQLEAALRLVPEHMPALDALESIHGEAGDQERVAAILGRKIAATARQPERQKALLARLAELQHSLGLGDAAREAYLRSLSIDPDYRPALLYLGAAARARGDLAEAAAHYQRIADAEAHGDPAVEARIDAMVVLFELARTAGRAADAERWILAAIAADGARAARPAWGEPHILRVELFQWLEELYLDTSRFRDAAAALEQRALLETNRDTRVELELRRLEILMDRALDPAAARVACAAALTRAPEDVRLWRRAATLARGAAPDELAAALAQVARRSSDPAERRAAVIEGAEAYRHAGNRTRARELLETLAGEARRGPPGEARRGPPDEGQSPLDEGQSPLIDETLLDALLELAREEGDTVRFAALAARRQELDGDPARQATLAFEEARLLLARDDADGALERLASVPSEHAPTVLLLLRAELVEEQGNAREAARDLATVRARAEADGDLETERSVARRLGALAVRLRDDQGAEKLYQRALELDEEDIASADALVAIYERRSDAPRAVAALERLLEIARRTAAGPAREAEILRELGRHALAAGDQDAARQRLDEACAVAPRDTLALRDRAALAATLGDPADRVRWLETLAAADETVAAEVLLELAEVYERGLADPPRAADALRRAAAVSMGPSRVALMQRADTLAPVDAIPVSDADVVAVESAPPSPRAAGGEIITAAAAESVRAAVARIRRLTPDPYARPPDPGPPDPPVHDALLDENSPEALADALAARARELVTRGEPLDDGGRTLLGSLRHAAHTEARFAPLADGLCAAAAAEPNPAFAAAWFAEAAALRKSALKDREGAIDALGRALALRPQDASVVVELDALLRDAGDFGRLADVYEMHLASQRLEARAPVLYELATLYAESLGDNARAVTLYEAAREADPTFKPVLLPLADFHYAEPDPGPAEDYYQRALAAGIVPTEDRGVVAGRIGELALKRGDVPTAVARFREGLEALEARRPAGAPHSPMRATIWSWLEHSLRAGDEWEEVVQLLLLRAREEQEPVKRLPLLREAAALLDGPLGQPDEADDVYAEILRLAPEDAVARARNRGAAPAMDDDELPPRPPHVATDISDLLAAADQQFGDALTRATERGKLREAEDWPALLALLDQHAAIAEPTEKAQLLSEAAHLAHSQLADVDGALARLAQAIDAAQDDMERAMLRADRAELLARLGRIADAKRDLEDALAVLPPTGMAHMALGRVHIAEGNHQAALPHLLAAADRDELDVKLTAEAHLLAGHAHEALGQVESAMARYEQASAMDPFDPRPLDALYSIGEARDDYELLAELIGRRILLGNSNLERARLWVKRAKIYRDVLHREPEAYRCFKEAVANDPTYLEADQGLRAVAAARGEWALCAELLYREIDAEPDEGHKAARHVELAQIYEERLMDVDAAIRNYESALTHDEHNPVPPPALARLYALAQRFHDAAHAEEIAASLELMPEARAERLLRAGEHLERIEHHAEARRLYDQAAAIDDGGDAAAAARTKAGRLGADAPNPAELRADLERRLHETDDAAEKLEIYEHLLRLAVEDGDDNEIDLRAREVLGRAPADLTAFLQRRRLLSGRGEWQTLAELCRARADAVEDHRERAGLYFDLGRICAQRLGDPNRAALAFEQALRHDPNHAAALDSLADMAYRQHDWDRAYTLYARLDAEASFLGQDVVHYRRGELAEMLGHEDQAEAAYRAAVTANPSHLSALEAQARLALYRGEITAAIAALKAVLDLLPLDDVERITTSRQQLGELCQRAGDSAAARGYFELVLVEDPSRVAALSPLADLYSGAGLWAKAAETLGRLSYLITTPEKRADILFRMGEIFRLQLDDEEAASNAYLKAIDLDPKHVPTMRRLIDYYWTQGDDGSLAEMAADLDARGELVAQDTSHETLAKVVISTALAGDLAGGQALGRALGDAAAGALAAVLADAVGRRPKAMDKLVAVARALCVAPGPPLDAVRAVLVMRSSKDENAEKIAVLL